MPKVIRIIDADSQFSTVVGETPRSGLAEGAERLLRDGILHVGHGFIGNRHNIVFVNLRNSPIHSYAAQLSAQLTALRDSPGVGFQPRLVIYPAESTADYWIDVVSGAIEQAKATHHNKKQEQAVEVQYALASAAFRSYATHELRLELNESLTQLSQGSQFLDVLFFDDSTSSGQTERLAIEAIKRHRATSTSDRHNDALRIRWVSVFAVCRNNLSSVTVLEAAPRPQVPARGSATSELQHLGSYSFCKIPIQTVSAGDCPACKGEARIRRCLDYFQDIGWASPSSVLDAAQSFVEPRHLDGPSTASGENTFPIGVSTAFLRLLNRDIPNHSIEWHSRDGHFEPKHPLGKTAAEACGELLFMVLHLDLISAYVSRQNVLRRLEKLAIGALTDLDLHVHIFVCLALLPTSILGACLEAILANGQPQSEIFPALTAIYFGECKHILMARVRDRQTLPGVLRKIEDHLRIAVDVMALGVGSDSKGNAKLVRQQCQLVINLLSRRQLHTTVGLLRKINDVLPPGDHKGYLYSAMRRIREDNLDSVAPRLISTIKWITEFDHWANAGVFQGRIDELVITFQTWIDCKAIESLRLQAHAMLLKLWDNVAYNHVARVRELVKEVKSICIPQSIRLCRLPADAFDLNVLGIPESMEEAKVVLLSRDGDMRDLILNLLINPFVHCLHLPKPSGRDYSLSRFEVRQRIPGGFVVTVSFSEDVQRSRFLIHVRSPCHSLPNPWARNLGIKRSYLRSVGGDLTYIKTQDCVQFTVALPLLEDIEYDK